MKKPIVLVLLAVLLCSCVSVSAAPGGNSVTISIATPDTSVLSNVPPPDINPSGSNPPVPRVNRQAYAAHLPNPQMTPGDVLDVTAHDICQTGYTQKVRDVPESVKNQVYEEYGIRSHQPGEYEVDHLISLELGGSNSVKNLWPEPYGGDWNAHAKDRLENELHKLVCDGQLALKTAQREIATDWIAAYQKYLGQLN